MNWVYRHLIKRLLDLMVATTAAVLLSPVIAAVALWVRCCLGSPVLFAQARPGLHGRIFTVFKLRTMSDARDSQGRLLPDEQRLSWTGQLIRRLSLDELPQLWNVIRGDMSLVGPRPLLVEYLELYSSEQARRHEIRPGITGWAQINGRNAISWEKKFELDVWYVDHVGFWLDLKILLLTVWKGLSRAGVSASGHATMPRFTGSDPGATPSA